MHLTYRNVNDAFVGLVRYFADGSKAPLRGSTACSRYDSSYYGYVPEIRRTESRNGPVLLIDGPVTITYEKPLERVLFNPARDANPFFHLYEALWMLAGRNDVAPLAYYAKQVAAYSDDGETLNGAYGYRWRHVRTPGRLINTYGEERDKGGITGPGTQTNRVVQRVDEDQLDILVAHLKADPASRRAVLQMWNVEDDLLKLGEKCNAWCHLDGNDLLCKSCGGSGVVSVASRDVCCNLSVMFSLREVKHNVRHGTDQGRSMTVSNTTDYLDMTVTNRSNDLVWGLLGANYVHFTILQEYMAARLGVEVGKYHHFTNNLHVYTETNSGFKPDEWLSSRIETETDPDHANGGLYLWDDKGYGDINTVPLVRDPETFERELPEVVSWYDGTRSVEELINDGPRENGWTEPFLEEVAGRLFAAFALHKSGDDHGAFAVLGDCPADDWRVAAESWLRRRVK